AFDPPRSRVVIGQAQGDTGIPSKNTTIFLANADGTSSTSVGHVDGYVQSASISRDGRWLLLVTQQNTSVVETSAWLMSIDPKNPSEGAGKVAAPSQPRRLDTV